MKSKFSKTTIVFIISIVIVVGLNLVKEYTNYEFLFFYINTETVSIVFFTLFGLGIIWFALKIKLHLIVRIMCILLSIVFLWFSWFGYMFALVNFDYQVHQSPNGNHTFVANNDCFLLTGSVNIYERVNPFFVKYKTSFPTDGETNALSSLYVEWHTNSVTFTYNDFYYFPQSETIYFD